MVYLPPPPPTRIFLYPSPLSLSPSPPPSTRPLPISCPFVRIVFLLASICARAAQRLRKAKNRDVNSGPFALPFACPVTLLTQSDARFTRALNCLLAHSLTSKLVGTWTSKVPVLGCSEPQCNLRSSCKYRANVEQRNMRWPWRKKLCPSDSHFLPSSSFSDANGNGLKVLAVSLSLPFFRCLSLGYSSDALVARWLYTRIETWFYLSPSLCLFRYLYWNRTLQHGTKLYLSLALVIFVVAI